MALASYTIENNPTVGSYWKKQNISFIEEELYHRKQSNAVNLICHTPIEEHII
jgi:hypothetical protein